jgi:pimeloyl-ACP methyl ester carboxylesterase
VEIDTLEEIELGGTTQWIRVRGADASNPVLLLMQQGPGVPMISDRQRLERELRLEHDFTVVYWDQRGTGLSARSLRRNTNRFEISVAAMVDDTVALLQMLRDRFGAQTFVTGFSFGATFAVCAAARRPDLVAAVVAAGMDIDMRAAEGHAYAFALDAAFQRGNRRAIRQLEAIGPPPHTDVKRFTTRARWVADFGGIATNDDYHGMLRALLVSLVRSPDYSTVDVIRALRGIRASQAALLPQLATTDLIRTVPRLDVPLVMAQGRHDQVAPGEAAQLFYDSLTAPSKKLVWFESSAHTPHLEEPDKFRDLLMSVRTGRLATTLTSRRAGRSREGPPRSDGCTHAG